MPRPKVVEERRKRIAKACIYCQTTKQKCDGLSPCVQCVKRDRVFSCVYSAHIRSYGRRRSRNDVESAGTMSPMKRPDLPSARRISLSPVRAVEFERATLSPVAIPKLPHNLHDASGRTMYLGDCASLSFLQHIQELIEGEQELAAVAADVGDFPVYEEVPPPYEENVLDYNPARIQEFEELVDAFFASTCGVVDIFGRQYVDELLSQWTSGRLGANSGEAALLYLVISYGAQARSANATDISRSQSFFSRGRQIALLELTNDPSLETVQAFIIICFYMLGSSRRNGAFLNLGIAISAAKSLGLHRSETNADFSEEEQRLRKRIWRTLRYHDLFFCAMMGRTSSILTTDTTVLDDSPLTPHSYADYDQELGLLESARAFSFMEQTVNEVYTKRNVPLGSLQRLSKALQEASQDIPLELRNAPSRVSSTESASRRQQLVIRNACVACNYYFTMLLLTRPFLITRLRANSRRDRTMTTSSNDNAVDVEAEIYNDITHGAVASVDAATKMIQLLHELMEASMLFNNMPLVVAWTFVSALTVCSAYLGRFGSLKECEGAIQQADDVLLHFTRFSPQARRYHLILKKLSRAALDYLRVTEKRERGGTSILMPEIFRLSRNPTPYDERSKPSADDVDNHPRRSQVQQTDQAESRASNMPSLPPTPRNSQSRIRSGVKVVGSNIAYDQEITSRLHEDASLLDLVQSFHDVNTFSMDAEMDTSIPYMDDVSLEIDDMDSIWNIKWTGALL